MKKFFKSTLALLLAALCLLYGGLSATVFAAVSTPTDAPAQSGEIRITAATDVIEWGKTVQLTADTQGVRWLSSDTKVATVDENGLVKGVAKGRAVITAYKGDMRGEFEIKVTLQSAPIMNYLSTHRVLSYMYSYVDDYYYVDSPNAWQRHYGFSKLYDIIAPYVLMEYDYARVHFEYEGKDWMIQIWKGQYGEIFYGGEVGVYNKEHSDKEDTVTTTYSCAKEEDWLDMQTTLYRDKGMINGDSRTGEFEHQFTTPYEKTWWSTGFKRGHLTQVEPASELWLTGRITLKDEEMTAAFVEGLEECGFGRSESKDSLAKDTFCVEGCDVYYSWQDLSYAENTMAIKLAFGGLGVMMAGGFLSVLVLAILTMMSMGLFALILI
ncbi:MAG: DUF4474 domain-containing protein [Clostridia bacterium]|nr:DUF4474 domain-containing protein [Clostridia bacterium]